MDQDQDKRARAVEALRATIAKHILAPTWSKADVHIANAALSALEAEFPAVEVAMGDWLDDFDGRKPAYTDRELLELFQMLLSAQIREERINSIEELRGLLRQVSRALAPLPPKPEEPR